MQTPRSAAPCPASATTRTARSASTSSTRSKLASLAHAAERAGKRLIRRTDYAARALRAGRLAPGGAAARLALREILTDKLMQLERGVLQTTFDPHGGKSADLPSSGADGATAELCAPSLSRLPYLFALFERLQSLGDLAQRAKPAEAKPADSRPDSARPDTAKADAADWPRRRRCDCRRGRGGLGGVVVDGGGAR